MLPEVSTKRLKKGSPKMKRGPSIAKCIPNDFVKCTRDNKRPKHVEVEHPEASKKMSIRCHPGPDYFKNFVHGMQTIVVLSACFFDVVIFGPEI